MTSNDNGKAANGGTDAEHHALTTITVRYDHATCMVQIGMENVKIGLAQMIVDEARRQLEYMRRMAQMQDAQQQLARAAQEQAIADTLRRGR